MDSNTFRYFLKHVELKFSLMYPTRSEIEHVQQANMYAVNGVKEFIELMESEAQAIVFAEELENDDLLNDFATS